MKKFNQISLAIIVAILSTACSRSGDIPEVKQNVSASSKTEETVYNDVKKLNFFNSGSLMATTQVYVLFDPQCPHCGALWKEVKDIKGVNFRWIPVAFMKPQSLEQGAMFLSSNDPAQAMNTHEELMDKKTGGIITSNIKPEYRDQVKINTEYWKQNFESVPTLVFKNNKTQKHTILLGGLTREKLVEALGLNL